MSNQVAAGAFKFIINYESWWNNPVLRTTHMGVASEVPNCRSIKYLLNPSS
jgi:hypothetical protein